MASSVNYIVASFYVRVIGCAASTISSVANLLVIYDMGIWNSHIMLITLMTAYQVMFDVIFYTWSYPVGTVPYIASNMIGMWGGIATTLVSNVMILNILYIMATRTASNLLGMFWAINIFACAPALLVDIVYSLGVYDTNQAQLAGVATTMYNSIRTASAGVNLICYILVYFLALQMTKRTFSADGRVASVQDTAMIVLVNRLKFYPLIQAVSRIPFACYESIYGLNLNPEGNSYLQNTALLITGICAATAPVGYFVVFLLMQPRALKHLMSRVTRCKPYAPAVIANQLRYILTTQAQSRNIGNDSDLSSNITLDTPVGSDRSNLTPREAFRKTYFSDAEDEDLFLALYRSTMMFNVSLVDRTSHQSIAASQSNPSSTSLPNASLVSGSDNSDASFGVVMPHSGSSIQLHPSKKAASKNNSNAVVNPVITSFSTSVSIKESVSNVGEVDGYYDLYKHSIVRFSMLDEPQSERTDDIEL